MSFRSDRLNSEMRKVIADIIENKLKDPRITEMVSVMSVDVAKDLKTAKVYLRFSETVRSAPQPLRRLKTRPDSSAGN